MAACAVEGRESKTLFRSAVLGDDDVDEAALLRMQNDPLVQNSALLVLLAGR